MKISYAICVCTEARELYDLIKFLEEVKRPPDEVIVLTDEKKVTSQVIEVISEFSWVKKVSRKFNGDFADHKNYLGEQCSGDYIFNIDADEIPQEFLVRAIEKIIESDTPPDLIAIPRINICLGYTQRFLKHHNFHCNENGWINWPDYQGRVYQKNLKWDGKVHERIEGFNTSVAINPHPSMALWHVKSTSKQDKQDKLYQSI
tara:strand:+ start:1314 stop:1922 length:609 start_codon:yes stop_codon:yes gene_type:complete